MHTLATDYLLELQARRNPKTAEYEKHLLRHFLDYCRERHLTLEKLTRREWLQFVATLRESHYSHWTVRGVAAVSQRFLKWLAQEGFLQPITKQGDLPKPPAPNPNPLSVKQLDALLHLTQARTGWIARRDTAIITCLLDTGLRRAELLQLTARDALTGVALVVQKGNRPHRVYLTEPTQRAIRAYLRAYTRETGKQLEPDDLLWRGVDGKPMTNDALRRLFRRLSQQYGERVYPHRLRSTSITLRLAMGASTELVREAIGHADERSLRHYAKLAESDKQRLIRETSPVSLLTSRRNRK